MTHWVNKFDKITTLAEHICTSLRSSINITNHLKKKQDEQLFQSHTIGLGSQQVGRWLPWNHPRFRADMGAARHLRLMPENNRLNHNYQIKVAIMRKPIFYLLAAVLFLASCKSWNRTQKGAAIGTASGAAAGAVIGKASGNAKLGAIIGATVGGATGAVIGHKMDKQAEEMQKKVPSAKVERVGEGIVVEFNSNVLFGFDRYDLTDDAKLNLNKLSAILTDYPDTDIEIQGHTDSKGSESYNFDLSVKRANAVKTYLATRSISSRRVTVVGYGESAPEYSNDSDDGRSQNRRVEFLITANEKMRQEAEKEAGNK